MSDMAASCNCLQIAQSSSRTRSAQATMWCRSGARRYFWHRRRSHRGSIADRGCGKRAPAKAFDSERCPRAL
ncbi:hypothetical protein XCV1078 [Xanthomonas euvesicatoria pv. vesicatoria str. 85-10]|uniref:Uncharacterized protein n=1 Tax=Xanthomonas euvesicatoria pv. vesicatoria (strain 85-10) TaxID=316273 RepID=Q3BWQ4_XANE5|nr:hypothetical protein XCV1078 [Xanthomonas euvesicatoria pv. vesicatoria str. 85-10]